MSATATTAVERLVVENLATKMAALPGLASVHIRGVVLSETGCMAIVGALGGAGRELRGCCLSSDDLPSGTGGLRSWTYPGFVSEPRTIPTDRVSFYMGQCCPLRQCVVGVGCEHK